MLTQLDQLSFDNQFVAQLPADPQQVTRPRQVHNAAFSWVQPSKSSAPQLISYSKALATELNLSPQLCQSEQFTQVFVGNQVLVAMQPFAMCYGGHQFGHWAGQLGDGRAINLGEILCPNGQHQTLQLKGAGLTPYSRTADGMAVLRSSIREFLCSEAMHHLGIPTTRALSLVLTGDEVVRDMFYDGRPEYEPTAVVCRVAPSFVRFGNFELPTQRNDLTLLKQLVDHTIKRDFAHLLPDDGEPTVDSYIEWYREVTRLSAEMVCHWMRVGFVHGVMNTDNLSILGLTIDYGPYGWLEDYDPNWTPNTTDAQGKRYCYGNQPKVVQWNLYQLANAIVPLIKQTEPLEQILNHYGQLYQQLWHDTLASKLGFEQYQAQTHDKLFEQLPNLLAEVETDMTIFFRELANLQQNKQYTDQQLIDIIANAYYQPDNHSDEYNNHMLAWLKHYQQLLQQQTLDDAARKAAMNQVNPKYVLRNYIAQQAIDKAHQGDYSMVEQLQQLLTKPYDEQPQMEAFYAKRPEWARVKAGCSMLSCSS